ncbi:phosphatases II [Coprinopsis marcescibilis]|uniref:protein-tyrosine-phosphatase n=1 Tax=Coprinopsis marcescibilis TaxID=230819 RepID=A0A5C3KH20_COPMA|nr:phosphatases II [Coprinopsis marcescibilis]
MSRAAVAIMPARYPASASSSHTYNAHPSTVPQMNYPQRSRARVPPLHQNTWPLMTNTTAVQGPPSASPFSPSQAMQATRNVSEIIPHLYISDLSFAESPSSLMSYRITHVLSTLPDTIFCPPPTLLPMQPLRMQIRVDDLPFSELAAHLPTTTAFIRDALANPESRVLVHCVEGISRSVSVVAAYLMAQYGWSPTEAVQYIKKQRRIAEPNFGFVQQLHEYAQKSLGRTHHLPPIPQFSAAPT